MYVDPLAAAPALAGTAAITAMLTVEGFLLATVGLAASLGAPGQRRRRKFLYTPIQVAIGAVFLMGLVSFAGLASWVGVYGGGQFRPFDQAVVAIALLVALLAQPAIGLFLALGLRLKT